MVILIWSTWCLICDILPMLCTHTRTEKNNEDSNLIDFSQINRDMYPQLWTLIIFLKILTILFCLVSQQKYKCRLDTLPVFFFFFERWYFACILIKLFRWQEIQLSVICIKHYLVTSHIYKQSLYLLVVNVYVLPPQKRDWILLLLYISSLSLLEVFKAGG